ncbi:acyl-CoA synthetase (AMP-forming)/AMP-acid ligase II [Desulfosalsimonas propionicica]|uniref:Acyl-CoA synthetase (AMP-forming)/AMP-acid ligase II n=1 Tax=Desulfosalsimonas propionicica TaxID=332175 RepID=A0A7W0CBE3_9BACT|nr:hypothetical protein [Desulfosalsimonas propionicica]MBA2882656.1 acyl-CoA synthetase (AMP-forming)/AMP-acid ligase II [Desulfosalsimonas propionicica]
MKIKEQTIKALDDLSEADLMLVNEWIYQLRTSRYSLSPQEGYKITYEQLHAATQKCKTSLSNEIQRQREDRL